MSKKKLKTITFFISNLTAGGAERVVTRLSNYWAANKSYQVNIITLGNAQPFYPLHNDIELQQIGQLGNASNVIMGLINNIKRLITLRKLIKKTDPSAIISFMTESNVKLIIATLFLKKNIIVSERENPIRNSTTKIWRILAKYTYKRTTHVVVQTNAVKPLYDTYNANLTVIRNPLLELDKTYRVDYNNKTIITIGRLTKKKRHVKAIEQFSKANLEGWQYNIVGEGEERKNIEKAIEKLNLTDKVHLIGRSNDVFKHLSKASIFLMLSDYEGYPNALIEAMSIGLACISCDCDFGPSEIINHEQNGLLIPKGEEENAYKSINTYINDINVREKHGREAAKIIDQIHIEKIVSDWERLIG